MLHWQCGRPRLLVKVEPIGIREGLNQAVGQNRMTVKNRFWGCCQSQ